MRKTRSKHKKESWTVPYTTLISPRFEAFSRNLVDQDGYLDVYWHRPAGPVSVAGGEFGPQTIEALAMDDSLASFLQSSLTALDPQLDLDFRFVSQPDSADLRFYLDSEINLGDAGATLGIALQNPTATGGFWECLINTPALQSEPDYQRFAALHEIGHVLGMEHPFDQSDGDGSSSTNPYKSVPADLTVMAYRKPRKGSWPQAYTSNDLAALRAIWGEEPYSRSASQLVAHRSDPIIGAALGQGTNELFRPRGDRDRITARGLHDPRGSRHSRGAESDSLRQVMASLVPASAPDLGLFTKGSLNSTATLAELTLGLPTDTLA